jgi:hypothetical protein
MRLSVNLATTELQNACYTRDAKVRAYYAPYVNEFVAMLLTKAQTYWHHVYKALMNACKDARSPKDRYILFHCFRPSERVYIATDTYVVVDELVRYTNLLKVLEHGFGPHFKVRILAIQNPNFPFAISLHYFP